MPTDPKDPQPLVEPTKPFSMLFAQIEGGALHEETTDQMRELFGELATLAAQNGKSKGGLTITLNFTFERNGVVEVIGDVKTKAPKVNREKSIFWVTPGSNLSVENPKQPSLPLRSVSNPETVRDVNPAQQPTRAK